MKLREVVRSQGCHGRFMVAGRRRRDTGVGGSGVWVRGGSNRQRALVTLILAVLALG